MRFVASTRCLAKPPTGIGHYTAETLRALNQIPGVSVREFPSRWIRPLARYRERYLSWWLETLGTPGPAISFSRFQHSLVSRLERFFLRQHDKPAWFTPRHSDVYLEPNHELMDTCLPTVAVVHDLSVLRFPQWHPAGRVAHHGTFFNSLIRRGDSLAVVTVSEAVRQEVIRLLGIPAERVVTGCNAPRSTMRPGNNRSDGRHLEHLGLRSGYFLHVGTLEPRKNLALLVRAWSRLDSALRASHPLVLAGGKGWGDEELQETLRKAPEGIHNLGYVEEAAIPALYRGALALVMPSHYEGYGMPVIEMRAVGGAVITSLDPAVREVAGPDTPGVDALDESGWTGSLRRAVEDNQWLEGQRLNGPAWASRHTWAQGAQAVVRAAQIAQAGAGASASKVAA